MVGTGIVDPLTLGQRLPAALSAIVVDPNDPSVLTATAGYAVLLEAQGVDVESLTRGQAAALAANFPISVDELAAFYQRFYESLRADVFITIGADGVLETLAVTADLSKIYLELASPTSGPDLGMTEADLTDFRKLFADTVWIAESVTTFEFDEAITVTPPVGDFEDRTDVTIEFFADLVEG